MSDGYWRYRQWYTNDGGSLTVTTLTGQTTLITVGFKGQNTIYVQRVHIHVNTPSPGITWSVMDSAGVPVLAPYSVAQTTTTVGDLQSIPTQDPIEAEFDFGPIGFALTPGANLLFVPSGTGAAGDITWDAYERLAPGTAALP